MRLFLCAQKRENQERSALLDAADSADWRSCPAGLSRCGNLPWLRPFCEQPPIKKLSPFGSCMSGKTGERQAELFFGLILLPFSQFNQYNLKEEQSFSLGKCSPVG